MYLEVLYFECIHRHTDLTPSYELPHHMYQIIMVATRLQLRQGPRRRGQPLGATPCPQPRHTSPLPHTPIIPIPTTVILNQIPPVWTIHNK